MRPLRSLWAAILAAACLSSTAAAQDARIAVAANLRAALDDLQQAFQRTVEARIAISSGSTGQLAAQIRNGAPFDVFLAADEKRPAELLAEGFGVEHAPYATGVLVLVRADRATPSGATFAEARGTTVAIANPRIAPYGAAAMRCFPDLPQRFRVAQAPNVAGAFAAVRAGGAHYGLVARSTALAAGWPFADLENAGCPRIQQDMLLLKRGADNRTARAFFAFMTSAAAKAVLERHGYAFD